MGEQDIKLNDWRRILIGEVPPEFLFEVLIRMLFLYALLVVAMRLIGRRINSQLTRNEMAALVSLAAATGLPILSPDRGILPAAVMCIVVVCINRLSSLIAWKNERAETALQGRIDTLVKNSVLQVDTMKRTRISRERVMAQLRSEKILHLGEVERLYFEANGKFTLIKTKEVRPGLTSLPDEDVEFIQKLKQSNLLVCDFCGMDRKAASDASCSNCGNKIWTCGVQELGLLSLLKAHSN